MITQGKIFLYTHWLAIGVMIAVGAVYASHNFFIPRFLGGEKYIPVTLSANQDEGIFYGPRANAVFYGQWRAGDINLEEHRGDPSLLPLLNPILLGIPARVFGSLELSFILSDFIFPALIFFAVYIFAFEMVKNKLAALLFGVIFIFSPMAGIFPSPDALAFFVKRDPLYFTRFEYPKVTFLFFVLCLYFTMRALQRGGRKNILYAGLCFGIMFYTYLYDWAYILVGLGIMGCLFMWERRWDYVRTLIGIVVVGFLLSVPYWVNFFQLKALPQYHDLFLRIGTEVSHRFRFWTVWKSYARNLFLIGLMLVFVRKRNTLVFTFLAALLCAYAVVVNVQVILGFNPQADHWYRISFLPIDLAIFACAYYAEKKYNIIAGRKFIDKAGYALIVLYIAWGVFSQYSFSKAHAKLYTIDAAYARSYSWMNMNTPSGSVIGSISFMTNSELPLFTHNKVFVANGGNSTASNEEIWKRFLLLARMFSLRPEQTIALARENNFYLFHDFYHSHEFDSYFYPRRLVADEAEKDYIEKRAYYEKMISRSAEYPNIYRLDYLYFGPRERIAGADAAGFMKDIHKIYDSDNIIIYEVSAPSRK